MENNFKRAIQILGSLQLAMILLAVLIVASITGTLLETSYDATTAGRYIYKNWWFSLFLFVLALNLACSVLSRYPWQRKHVGFVITHLGIIVILAGSLVDKIWGIEGFMTLNVGDSPVNVMMLDRQDLEVVVPEQGLKKSFPVSVQPTLPSPAHPIRLTIPSSDVRVSVIGYEPALTTKVSFEKAAEGPAALRFTLSSPKMPQGFEQWLLLDDKNFGKADLGIAQVQFTSGIPPTVTPGAAPKGPPSLERMYLFSEKPDSNSSRPLRGQPSGLVGTFLFKPDATKGTVELTLGERKFEFPVAENIGKPYPLAGTEFAATIKGYYPDFRLDEKMSPTTASDEENNPALQIEITGPPTEDDSGNANSLVIYCSPEGALRYLLHSNKNGWSVGDLAVDKPLELGWTDFVFTLREHLPAAKVVEEYVPTTEPRMMGAQSSGILVKVDRQAASQTQWVPLGMVVRFDLGDKEAAPVHMRYANSYFPLDFSVSLTDFKVERDEGTDRPASFKSFVRFTDAAGDRDSREISMNNPANYPPSLFRSLTGMTYKFAQSSWNPQNERESTLQIVRDPGWAFKWIGSLLVCAGIFITYYLKRYFPKDNGEEPIQIANSKPTQQPRSKNGGAVRNIVLLVALFSAIALASAQTTKPDQGAAPASTPSATVANPHGTTPPTTNPHGMPPPQGLPAGHPVIPQMGAKERAPLPPVPSPRGAIELSGALDFEPIRLLAVQHGGRKKPLDTFAREIVHEITGTEYFSDPQSGVKLDPVDTVLSMWIGTRNWEHVPCVLVKNKGLKNVLGLPADETLFEFSVLAGNDALKTLLRGADTKDDKELNPLEKEARTVWHRLSLVDSLVHKYGMTIVPHPTSAKGQWTSLEEAGTNYDAAAVKPVFDSFQAFIDAYQQRVPSGFVTASHEFQTSFRDLGPDVYPNRSEMKQEVRFNWMRPFHWSWMVYGLAFFVGLARFRSGSQKLYWTTCGLFALGLLLNVYGFYARCSISGRMPVSNMYESVIWVGFGAAAFAMIFELAFRSRYFLLAAAPVAVLALGLADAFPNVMDPHIGPLNPVLRSKLWLGIHVLTIMLGYVGLVLAWAIANIAMGYQLFSPRRVDVMKALHLDAYRAIQIGLLLLTAGTILGGVWAYFSWGRFWGWDPKETWALISILCYLFVLHGKAAGWWEDFGVTAGFAVCFMAVIMAWYGVNFVLGKGLHSYGSGSGGAVYVAAVVVLELIFVGAAVLAHKKTLLTVPTK